jgi:hypothetical protein
MKYNRYVFLFIIFCVFLLLLTLYRIVSKKVEAFEDNTIFCFWTGYNEMSENRKRCLEKLKQDTECRIVLVTPENLDSYILPEHPLHEAYPYLSETHKADYLRTYFMHFYGGGYSDIKEPGGSWKKAFDDMRNSDAYINGYRESGPGDIAFPEVAEHYNSLVGNGAYIVKPNTSFTHAWYSSMLDVLDKKIEELKRNPAKRTDDVPSYGNGYPIEWAEILGRIFHRVSMDILDYILFTVPRPIMKNYR